LSPARFVAFEKKKKKKKENQSPRFDETIEKVVTQCNGGLQNGEREKTIMCLYVVHNTSITFPPFISSTLHTRSFSPSTSTSTSLACARTCLRRALICDIPYSMRVVVPYWYSYE